MKIECSKNYFKIFFTTKSWSFQKKNRKGTAKATPKIGKIRVLYIIYIIAENISYVSYIISLQRIFALPAVQCKWYFFTKMEVL